MSKTDLRQMLSYCSAAGQSLRLQPCMHVRILTTAGYVMNSLVVLSL